MKRIRLMCLLIVFSASVTGQEMKEGLNFPPYPLPESKELKSGNLPVRVDNSVKKYFPPVFNQYGWSCNQASSIGYLLTYELARIRDVSAYEPENQYPPLYAWNFLNRASTTNGVSYFDSWEIIKANGCPNIIDYPYFNDGSAWMSGYDKYHRAMENKVHHNYSLSVSTPEGLQRLKRYLHDHFTGSKNGGLANFQIGSGGIRFSSLPAESYNAGSPIITGFGAVVGHAMTIVGYDDSVKVDFNGDGRFTNDIDTNGDFIVDMSDWEKGALIVVNSWGKDWGDGGKSYVAYRVLTRYGYEGGFWNRSVHMIDLVNNYSPQLSLKTTLVHPVRNSIKIIAGVATDPNAEKPEIIMDFPLFNYQGGGLPFGGEGAEASEPFELGLDISPLLSNIESGIEAKFFLGVIESGGYTSNSRIKEFAIVDHTRNDLEIISSQREVPLSYYDTTFMSVRHNLEFKKVKVKDYQMEFVSANNWYSKQLEAANLTSPFQWELDYGYKAEVSDIDFVEIEGTELHAANLGDKYTRVDLPFSFPFYGEKFDEIIINDDGGLFFENEFYEYPYIVDPNLIFKIKKGIIAFGQDLVYYGDDNSISYSAGDSVFSVMWNAMGVGGELSYQFRIICKLYPNGKIEFHYGPVENQNEFWVNYDAGISRGDGRNFVLSPLAEKLRYRSNSMISLTPHSFPDKISLDYSGMLLCRPEKEDTFYDIHVRVKDKLNQVAYGVVPLSTVNLENSSLLDQNFPNPFQDNTSIGFLVSDDTRVRIEVFDISGRKVAGLVDRDMTKGKYSLEWNGRDDKNLDIPPGVYIARLKVADRIETIKMLKIRR